MLLSNYKFVTHAIALAAAAFAGYHYSENGWEKRFAEFKAQEAEQAAKIKELELQSQKVNVETIIKYVDRVKVVKEKGATIVKEIPVYISEKSDNRCIIPAGFVWAHDSAANPNDVSSAPVESHDEATDIKLSTVTETVVDNYTRYHEVVEQLRALQDWVNAQDRLINKK